MSQACPALKCLLLLSPGNPENPWTEGLQFASPLFCSSIDPPPVVLLGCRAYLTLALTDVGVGVGSLRGKLAWVWHGPP